MPDLLEQTAERAFASQIELRQIDEDSRRATFVIATENEVRTMFGVQVLRMSGVDLARFRSNPVVLDTHNRFELGAIIGKALSIKKSGRALEAEVEFADTERAEVAWQLVKTGFVRAASVGFTSSDVLVLDEGESEGRGEARVEGPATIVKKWELTEFSLVPVPADVDTLKRSFFEGDAGLVPGLVRTIVKLTETNRETRAMPEKKEKTEEKAPEKTAEERGFDALPSVVPLDSEIATRDLEAHAGSIRAITPRGLEAVADQCIVENLSLKDARARLLQEQSKRMQTVGTPEPVIESTEDDEAEGETRVKDLEEDEFCRAITG